jgi:hypothetical protein
MRPQESRPTPLPQVGERYTLFPPIVSASQTLRLGFGAVGAVNVTVEVVDFALNATASRATTVVFDIVRVKGVFGGGAR